MPTLLPILAAVLVLVGLLAYSILGGADFGAGVWDLFASGPRKTQQRHAIHNAIGPVWEANHVWLIFVIVVLFTCFPSPFSAIVTSLFFPLHLALLGIMLRGAAFAFHHYDHSALPGERKYPELWQSIFGITSLITPFFLGTIFGAVTSGEIDPTHPVALSLDFFSISCGFLAIAAFAYLAAIFLCVETAHDPDLREDFRRRAVSAGTATAILAAITLIAAKFNAPYFATRLLSASWVILPGLAAFALSAWAVFTHRFRLARIFAVTEITLMLTGWAVAQYPYVLFPYETIQTAAAPLPMLRFMLVAVALGLCILIPSLVYLFRVFKTSPNPTP